MAKKHYTSVAIILSGLLFIVFWRHLPVEVSGSRPGNVPMLIFFNALVAITLGVFSTFILMLFINKSYTLGLFSTLGRFRHLLFLMVKRDFVTRYRRSILGILWSLLNPLLTMLVLTMVFSTIFRFDIEYYPLYLLSGQLIFNFFNESTTLAMGSVTGSANILKKVYVPRYVFPLSRILSSVVNLLFSFLAFMIVFIILGHQWYWTMLLVPVAIIYIFIFALGIGMLLSALAVFFRDINYIYTIGTTLLMFLTPIFWPVSILEPRVYHLIYMNPMFHFVNYFREVALFGNVPGLWPNILCLTFAMAAFGVGLAVKIKQQDKYILYL